MLDNHDIKLPDKIDNAKVKKAADEYARLRAELATEHRLLSEHEEQRHQAEEADRQALADARRAGKPDPGQAKLQEAEAAIVDSRRRVEALTLAVADSRRDLVATVEAQRQEWQRQLDAKVAEAAAAFASAVEAVAFTHEALAEATTVSIWLRGFPNSRLKPATRTARVEALVSRNGSPESWPVVLAALRDHAVAVAAQPEAPKVAASV